MTAKDPVAMLIAIFSQLGTWLTGMISSLETVFWNAETGLTFIGSLSAVAVAIGVTFLVVNWIRGFIKLR